MLSESGVDQREKVKKWTQWDDAPKAVLGGKLIALNVCITKKKKGLKSIIWVSTLRKCFEKQSTINPKQTEGRK